MGTPRDSSSRYSPLKPLAVGGMAAVELAVDTLAPGMERLVVLKRIRPDFAREPDFERMFLNEARIACALAHPNVCRVLDFGRDDSGQYLVLEHIHGHNLGAVLREAAPAGGLPLNEALAIVNAVAAGLHYVHEHCDAQGKHLEIVHRDVSPANVLVGYDGAVRLIDFGVSKSYARSQTESGALKGKAAYMSPEQCEGAVLDRRSDVFALGILLYETSLGVPLFRGRNEFEVMNKIRHGEYSRPREVDPDYPEQLEGVIVRALQADPEDRFPTAEALLREVESFAQGAGLTLSSTDLRGRMRLLFGAAPPLTLAPLVTPDDPTHPIRRGSRWVFVLAFVAVGLALGVLALSRGDADSEAIAPANPNTVVPRERAAPTQAASAEPDSRPIVAGENDTDDTDDDTDDDAADDTAGTTVTPPPRRERRRAKRARKPRKPLRPPDDRGLRPPQ